MFFKNLYTEEGSVLGRFPIMGKYPRLTTEDIDGLCRDVSDTEIAEALFGMSSLKAPGVDGFQALFFQKKWDVVGAEVCKLVSDSFNGSHFDPLLNKTLLVLIPKVDGPEGFTQF